MPMVNWEICNNFGTLVGEFTADEDATLKVPPTTDKSGEATASSLGVGDYFFNGKHVVKITADLNA